MKKIKTYIVLLVIAVTALLWPIPCACLYSIVWRNNERRRMQMHEILSRYFRFVMRMIPGARFDIDNNGENFEKPAIIISNHQSHLDLLSIIAMSPRVVAITNKWVWNFPFYAPVIRYLEFYPIADGLDNGEEHVRSLMARGYSVLIFPEGTRSADNKILKFRRGAFYLAERVNADIVPIYLDGPGRVLNKRRLEFNPGTISVKVGKRVAADDTSMGENYREKTRSWHKHYLQWETTLCNQ